MRIACVILAAGAGRRAGGPKAFLPYPGTPPQDDASPISPPTAGSVSILNVGSIPSPIAPAAPGAPDTFLTRVARVARDGGCSPILAVVRPQDRQRAASVAPGLAMAVNPDPDRGMLSSLRTGLDALPPMAGVLVFPVDHPHVAPATIRVLLAAFAADPGAVAKPSFEGRGGHPVVLPWALAESLPVADREGGLGEALRASGARVTLVAVDDPGILRNVNVPGEPSG